MSHSDPPSFTFQAPPGWDALKSTTPRRTTDGPILPVELMSIVIENLTNDRSLSTIASLQSTSKEMYNMATPALYQHIIVDQRQAVRLFRLFEFVSRRDNTIFLHPAPPDPSAHLINFHLADRLMFFFSNTQSLSLKTTRRSDRPDYSDTTERLARYKELQNGLLAFNGPTLWPKLERCEWFPRPWQTQLEYEAAGHIPKEDEVLLGSIFAGLHPNQLVIQIPDFPLPVERLYYDLSSCVKHWRANHIHFFDYTMGSWGSMPRASNSMTIHYRKYSTAETDDWEIESLYELYLASTQSPFDPLDRFVAITELTLVGMPATVAHPLDEDPSTQTEVLDSTADVVLDDLMTFRLQHRNINDLKVTLQADFSPEGEAAAVSRVFKLPWRP